MTRQSYPDLTQLLARDSNTDVPIYGSGSLTQIELMMIVARGLVLEEVALVAVCLSWQGCKSRLLRLFFCLQCQAALEEIG